jgi:nucleoside-diphosphate-sugar epimerase
MRVLITGAAGFVGSHILDAMRDTPAEIIAACRAPNRLPEWFDGEVRVGDLRDPKYVYRLAKDVDVICHAAAWSSLFKHADESHELYYLPSIDLLQAAVETGVNRFVFCSSTAASLPSLAHNALAPGEPRRFWPHQSNLVAIEAAMRRAAQSNKQSDTTMVSLRLGPFIGERYSLGLLPILLPRLRSHLVPWVAGGRTPLPLIAGEDVGQAFRQASLAPGLSGYEAFNIVGPETPTAREVVEFLHQETGTPLPHFGVSFPAAYAFARLMELLDHFVPWQPLIVRSIVYLLEDFGVTNDRAEQVLAYRPRIGWRDAIRRQLHEMAERQMTPMAMAKPVA